MAQERREEREAQMEAAKDMFTDSRASLTPAELREIYQDMSGESDDIFTTQMKKKTHF